MGAASLYVSQALGKVRKGLNSRQATRVVLEQRAPRMAANICGVVLEKRTSSFANCTPGTSYGCTSAHRMYVARGCRGKFRCGVTAHSVYCSSHGWEQRTDCSCVPCEWRPTAEPSTSTDDALIPEVHCCADNGATLEYGSSWSRDVPSNANVTACRSECARTVGCSHYVYSDAPDECTDELRGRMPSRCTLCAACTRRQQVPLWQKAFTSYALSARASHVKPELSAARGMRTPTRVPAIILSGCDARYERAAAVARRAGLDPNWLPAVFPHNVAPDRPACTWPSAAERNLVAAHRNAWSLIASTNISMVVLEDDIELASSAGRLHVDVQRCEARRAECALLFVGFVDAFWATHALYLTPWGARQLIERSAQRRCPEPTDYYTHRLCQVTRDFGQTNHRLASHCLAPTAAYARRRELLEAGLRPPELYGVGHFVQNRTLGVFIHSQNALTGKFGSGSGTKGTKLSLTGNANTLGANC